MNNEARPMSDRNSASPNSCASMTAGAWSPSRSRAALLISAAAPASEGPEVTTNRRKQSDVASVVMTSTKDSGGQRRNGLPALA